MAYALAGTVDIDLQREPLGQAQDGSDIFLKDIWPTQQQILDTIQNSLTPALYQQQYGNVYDGNATWNEIPSQEAAVYGWDAASTYIQEPPFFIDLAPQPQSLQSISGARVLVMAGDSMTTDHISPAGAIAVNGPAGIWLQESDVGSAVLQQLRLSPRQP